MNKIFTCVFSSLLFIAGLVNPANAQQQFFKDINESKAQTPGVKRVIVPEKYRTLSLDSTTLLAFLRAAPIESNIIDRNTTPVLEIPMPDGTTAHFHIWKASVMAPELEAQFPHFITLTGQGMDDRTATIKLDWTELGFHAMILSPVSGTVMINPYHQHTLVNYISYFKKDLKKNEIYTELPPIVPPGLANRPQSTDNIQAGPCRGTQLYTYRLAVACTHEYAIAATGQATPTVAQTLSAIVTTVNRVDGVYETEIAVRIILIANETAIIFPTAAVDPFTGNNNANTLIGESQTVIDANIGNANYDVGHTFSTGGGGLSDLGVICTTGSKASSITGSPSPVGDGYDIDYVAHEMGHAFGGNHPFNSTTSNCGGGNRNASTAYEVGSGTSIMAYAGICGADDIQPHSDPYFYSISFDEISNYAAGGGNGCKVAIPTNNHIPVITAMNNNGANIPLKTPFTLTGAATDADGDALTYSWEEWDLGAAGTWNSGAGSTTKPLFKQRNPKTTGSRTFPDISVILAGYPAAPAALMDSLKGETLDTVARAMKFRFVVRDNHAGGGGVATGGSGCATGFTTAFQINSIAGTGPFVITVPNGGEIWAGGSTKTVTWNVAGTFAAPISCTNVNILMSIDGGKTYPTTVLANTPNDGSEAITVPNITTCNTVRFKIESVGNIFFDISNANFTITHTVPVSLLNFDVKVKNNHTIQLNWQTAFETNNLGFEVYRSTGNSNQFTQIGFVNGAGNSQVLNNYELEDPNVQKNVRYYYFLKQVDVDNHKVNSATKSAIISENKLANVSIHPNPASDNLMVNFGSVLVSGLHINMFDMAGKLVRVQTIGAVAPDENIQLDVSSLSTGMYMLQLITSESTQSVKFVKQ